MININLLNGKNLYPDFPEDKKKYFNRLLNNQYDDKLNPTKLIDLFNILDENLDTMNFSGLEEVIKYSENLSSGGKLKILELMDKIGFH